MLKLFVVGLGNPGAQYAMTRHNVGKEMVRSWAKEQGLSFEKQKGSSRALLSHGTHEVVVAYPDDFMNLSGKAVASL